MDKLIKMDSVYDGKTKEEIIDLIFFFHLQNTNGRENHDEMFKKGIEAAIIEIFGDEDW